MTTNVLALPCGASIVTDKVCGRYYMKAVQDCTGKNIIVLHSEPLKNVRGVRAYLKKRLEMYDWRREFTKDELKLLCKWMLTTKTEISARVMFGIEPQE